MTEPIDELAMQRFTQALAAALEPGGVLVHRNKPRPVDLAVGSAQVVVLDGPLLAPAEAQVANKETLDQIVHVEGFVGLEAATDPLPALRRLRAQVRVVVAENQRLEGLALDTRHLETDFDLDRTTGLSLTAAFQADFAIRLRTPWGDPYRAA